MSIIPDELMEKNERTLKRLHAALERRGYEVTDIPTPRQTPAC